MNTKEFMGGQLCYQNNQDCPVDASEDFLRGYGVEYELAEIRTHQSIADIGKNQEKTLCH